MFASGESEANKRLADEFDYSIYDDEMKRETARRLIELTGSHRSGRRRKVSAEREERNSSSSPRRPELAGVAGGEGFG